MARTGKNDTHDEGTARLRRGYRAPLLDLFPAITPYSSGFLSVDDLHTLYWEQSGNPEGTPILFLHGGPGAGATPTHRRFFDPDHYRIVIFDQRGAGRSHPLGCLENNTTAHLVEDIERLRAHLGIDRWHVFGGSWGSTLALRYATHHPHHCSGLILRGIFLCEKEEIDWFLYGMRTVFPEAWEQFASVIPQAEQSDLLGAFYKRLTGTDISAQIEAAIRWHLYEGACSSLYPNYETITTEEQKQNALSMSRIEAHYFVNELISATQSILNDIPAFRHIPSVIVQGRYDLICPLRTAHRLHQLWPEADYVIVPDAGHSALDPPLRSRLIEATESFKSVRS
ncbi:MAG: prolyl aminopeptidase [Alphaproteobacteria bacterium]|nr:prolyl aminopeptidase [Alphaproteobacteria bacterium]